MKIFSRLLRRLWDRLFSKKPRPEMVQQELPLRFDR